MEKQKNIIIGTRGSRLALAQTALVAEALKKRDASLTIEIKIITTKGDTNQSPIPLDTVGKAWFTGEIEQALLAGEIDLAVHSLKDMTPEITPGLTTVIVLERGDPRDVLIAKKSGKVGEQVAEASGMRLKDLPHGAIVGTDSIRRKVLLLDQRPDLVVKSIRGNVDTRLKKLYGENVDGSNENASIEKYDAIVLAAAGLERLGMLGVVSEFFDPAIFSIAPGQGVLAAQTRADQTEILSLLYDIEHIPTRIAAEAELAFSHAIGGGCKLPIGCYAKIEGDNITVHGMMGGADAKDGFDDGTAKVIRKSITGSIDQAVAFATALAREFL